MPKGVEHTYALWMPFFLYRVPTSVMPKGVEHVDILMSSLEGVGCRPL